MSTPDGMGEALVLTQKMLELAEKGEWEDVAKLEQKQSALLKTCFQPETAPAEIVQEILSLHEKIFKVSSLFRHHAKKELLTLQKGRNASRAYLSNSA